MSWPATADGETIAGPRTPAALLELLDQGRELRLVDLPLDAQLTAKRDGATCVVRLSGADAVRWRMSLPLAAQLVADAMAAHRIPPSSDWVMGDAASPRLRRLRASSGEGAAATWIPLLPAVDWIGRRLEEGRAVELVVDLRERLSAIPHEDGSVRIVAERLGDDGEWTARVVPDRMVIVDAAEQILLAWLSLGPRPAVAQRLVAPDVAQRAELEAARERVAPDA